MEMPYGPYRGKLLAELPLSYLQYLSESITDNLELLWAIIDEVNWRKVNDCGPCVITEVRDAIKQVRKRRRRRRRRNVDIGKEDRTDN